MTENLKIRINADDFGISPGVNLAIEEMFQAKKLHSASLICGCGHFEEAILIARRNPDLKIGLHFNLSVGNSIAGNSALPILTRKDGRFKNGFLKILILSIFKRKQLLIEVEKELQAQINLLKNYNIKINHIDGHRHIHFIIGIFAIVQKIAQAEKINNIRIINENLFATLKINHSKKFLFNGGIIKWLILKALGIVNQSSKIKNPPYFFSILYTGMISKDLITKIKIPKKFHEVEIMIHPAKSQIDQEIFDLEERKHLLNHHRQEEML